MTDVMGWDETKGRGKGEEEEEVSKTFIYVLTRVDYQRSGLEVL